MSDKFVEEFGKAWYNTVCLDWDGVLFKFGVEDAGEPVDGAIAGLYKFLDAGWWIEIFSGRSATAEGITGMYHKLKDADHAYRNENGITTTTPLLSMWGIDEKCQRVDRIMFATDKPVAKLYVDDRGFHFESWADLTPEKAEAFRAVWQHPDSTH